MKQVAVISFNDGQTLSAVWAGETVAEAAHLVTAGEVFIVYDAAVAQFAGEFAEALGRPVLGMVALEVSEQEKSMDTVLAICRAMLGAGVSRKAMLVSIGGGITSDIAGFAASIYKRGIPYANIPTTLLSQVDAGLGGKTGVNMDNYKNILGVFAQPVFTYLCPEVLATLPRREFLSGAAELLKTFIIDNGSGMYSRAVDYLCGKEDDLGEIIAAAAAVKAGIVSRDPFEKHERKKLNLGHTFAHAIEHEARLRGDDITHGEAVAMGIILAASLAVAAEETAPPSAVTRLRENLISDFKKTGLPTECPYPAETLFDAIRRDKKAAGDRIDLVIPRAIGNVTIENTAIDDLHFA